MQLKATRATSLCPPDAAIDDGGSPPAIQEDMEFTEYIYWTRELPEYNQSGWLSS